MTKQIDWEDEDLRQRVCTVLEDKAADAVLEYCNRVIGKAFENGEDDNLSREQAGIGMSMLLSVTVRYWITHMVMDQKHLPTDAIGKLRHFIDTVAIPDWKLTEIGEKAMAVEKAAWEVVEMMQGGLEPGPDDTIQ